MTTRAPLPALPTADLQLDSGEQSRGDGVILSVPPIDGAASAGSDPVPGHDDPERYEVGREIARGGMGRIVEAFDRRYQRRVAIKFLLRTTSPAARRFQREVRLTARLAHPSIVTLFDAGRWGDGRPFFAMKLVEGRSLDEAVAAASTLERKLALVPHVVAATEALAYAHEHRVIHRDLKPSNILVGAFGETVVIDWGLAKDLAGEEPELSPAASYDSLEDDESSALTTAGRALGTPSYMPPEQAQGGRADARSDVYALGAILYHVLAGAPPYAGPSASVTLDLVLAGPPIPLETRSRGLPADLVAIVRKAMAREPGERYATTKAMASDLTRFAAGQLVAARTYSTPTLVRRWVGRHRLALAFTAALIACLLVVGGIGVRRVVVERRRADAARASAETHRLAAEDLVDFVLGTLRERLEPLGKLELLSGVGSEVQDYYRRVGTADDALDVGALNRRAAAFETLANVEYAKRNMTAAVGLWTTAIEWRERARIASADPKEDVASSKLVVDETRIADVDAMEAHFDVATLHLTKARAISDAALARGETPALLLAGADLDGEAALIARQQGRPSESEALLNHAVSQAKKVVDQSPEDEDAEWSLERALFDRGYNAEVTKKLDEAAADLTTCTAILQHLLARTPGDIKRLRALGWSASVLGYAETGRRHMTAAEQAARTTLDARIKIAAIDPANAQSKREVMGSRLSVCQIEGDLGRYAAAIVDCSAGLETAEQAHAAAPLDHTAAIDLIALRDNLGFAYLYSGHAEEARAKVVTSVALAEDVVTREPSSESWTTLHNAAFALGLIDLRLGDLDRASSDYETAARAASHLEGDGASSYQARAAQLGGRIAIARGDLAEAEKRLRAALPVAESAHERASSDVETQVRAGELSLALARTLEQSHGASAESKELARRGHALIDPLREAGELWSSELEELRALGAT